MGVLDLAGLFLLARALQDVVTAVAVLDKGGCGGLGLVGDAHAVRSQIGDQGDRSLALYLDALVELLGDPHGLLGGEVEDLAGLLLERGGREGQGLFPGPLGPADLPDGEGSSLQSPGDPQGILLFFQVDPDRLTVLPDLAVIMGRQGLFAALDIEDCVQGPVFLWYEGVDLVLPVPDHAQGDGLDPARGQASLDLLPQKGRDLVADHAVQDAAGLLGVDQGHIDLPGVFERFRDRLFRDLVEGDPGNLLVRGLIELERGLEVPGDRFALPVRVRCQIDAVRLFDQLAQARQELSLAADRDVFGLIIMFDIDAHLTLGEVAYMSVGRRHLIRGPQKLLDRLHLGG